MKLTEQKYADVSDVKVSFFTSRLECHPWENHDDLLVISYKSQSDVNSRDLCFMDAMRLSASVVWRPAAIILDFRELFYKWGDTMEYLFQTPYPSTELQKIFEGDSKTPFPIVAVISDKCRSGMTSLVRQEMASDPSTILFETIEEAVAAIEARLH